MFAISLPPSFIRFTVVLGLNPGKGMVNDALAIVNTHLRHESSRVLSNLGP